MFMVDPKDWISKTVACRRLGVGMMAFPKVAAACRIRTRTVPGHRWTMYSRSDVERAARELVKIEVST